MDLIKLWENKKSHCSHRASIGQAQTSWAGSPRAKTGSTRPWHRAGAAVAGRIPGKGRCGTVGQRRLGHGGGAADQFEGKRVQETHRTGHSMAVHVGRVGALMRGATWWPLAWMVG
jgi:hypothetical protein